MKSVLWGKRQGGRKRKEQGEKQRNQRNAMQECVIILEQIALKWPFLLIFCQKLAFYSKCVGQILLLYI